MRKGIPVQVLLRKSVRTKELFSCFLGMEYGVWIAYHFPFSVVYRAYRSLNYVCYDLTPNTVLNSSPIARAVQIINFPIPRRIGGWILRGLKLIQKHCSLARFINH